jgi:hypothetical protein
MVSGAESNELGTMENMRPYVIAMLFIIKFRLDVGSRLNCSAQIESEKMDDVAFILDDQNCVAACRFDSPILSPKLFQFLSEVFGRFIV